MANHGKTASNTQSKVDQHRQQAAQPAQPTASQTAKNSATNTASASTATKSPHLAAVSAAVAMNRALNAPQDRPFNLTDEQKKAYEGYQKVVAEKRGIAPEQDGSYKKEHLANELSPAEVLKYAAFEYYKETKDNQQAFNNIQQEIENVYDKNPESPEAAPKELAAINSGLSNRTFLTDNDFLSLLESDEKKAIEYLDSLDDYPVEKANIQKLFEEANIKNAKAKTNASDEKVTGKLKKDNRDPDGPGGSDQKVEATEGDIIKWMMKDIILKELINRWVDKAVDKEIALICGTIHIAQSGNRRLLDMIVDGLTSSKASVQPKPTSQTQPQAQNQAPNTSQSQTNGPTPTAPSDTKEELSFEETIKSLEDQKAGKLIVKTPFKYQLDLYDDLIKHKIVLKDDGYKRGNKKQPYSKFGLNLSNEAYKETLQALQISYNAIALNILKDSIDPNGKNKELRTAIDTWFISKIKELDKEAESGKTSKKNPALPEIFTQNGLTEKDLNNRFEESLNKACINRRLAHIRTNIDNATSIFASNYTQYKLFEMARSSKEEDVKKLQDPKELKKLRTQFEAEGKILMLKNFEALRSGNEKAITAEEMIQLSENMAETSKKLYNKKDSKTQSPNLVEKKIDTTIAEPISLKDLPEDDVLSIEYNNLKILDKEEEEDLKNQQNNLDDKRDSIKAMKERVRSSDKKKREQYIQSIEQMRTPKGSGLPRKQQGGRES